MQIAGLALNSEFVIAKLYLYIGEQKWYNNLANNQSRQNIEIKSRERFQVTKTPSQLIDNTWANFKIEASEIEEGRRIWFLNRSTMTQ
jgi:hypothetical protein